MIRTSAIILALALFGVNCNVEVPGRPTRTLGSLFGGSKQNTQAKAMVQQQQQTQTQQNAQVLGNVRPLVYQVKYYERGNSIVDVDPRVHQPFIYGAVPQAIPASEKTGVVVDQPQVVGVPSVQPHPYYYTPPQPIPQRVYYNPLIPQAHEPQVLYTIANIGNHQVLIPCTESYDSTIAMNVEPQQATLRVPQPVQQQQPQPPAISQSPHPQRTPPQHHVVQQQYPLVRDQVVQAAHELSGLNNIPGGAPIQGIVGANINNVTPYTQGSYFYYYTLPTQYPQYTQPQYNQPQYVYKYGNQNVVPVVVNGYVPQPTNTVNVRQPVPTPTTVQQQQSNAQVTQTQVTQQQQQQQTVKG